NNNNTANEECSATKYEQDHVHNVYEAIATHFSQTRYKPWPIVAEFLSEQPVGSIGLDAGSGNGKYLHGHNLTARSKSSTKGIPIGAKDPQLLLNQEPRYFLIGLDRSFSLLSLSSNFNSDPELLNGDCIKPPIRDNFSFDFIISIATLHHFSTHERRCIATKSLLRLISGGKTKGRLLIFVWAFEQGEQSRRKLEKGTLLPAQHLPNSNLIQTSDVQMQDVLVPWVTNKQSKDSSSTESITYNRFYHLFHQGELIDLVHEAATSIGLINLEQGEIMNDKGSYKILKHGWEADNWWVDVEV
ncbi:hypothetical protein CROQUDRAFT_9153, partial [Cronartium quercuum f. sp. fusiforme G11]